jgi:hypothetical protein
MTVDRLSQIMLNQKLLHNFEKWCKYSSHITAKSCKTKSHETRTTCTEGDYGT